MNLMQLPDAKRQVSEEKREQRTKHNRFQITISYLPGASRIYNPKLEAYNRLKIRKAVNRDKTPMIKGLLNNIMNQQMNQLIVQDKIGS